MPASSGLYRIKHGRVLRTLQKTSAFIFIAYIAACSTCGGTVAATTAPATAAATASEEASAMATATTMAPGQQEHSATSSLSLSSGSQSEALQRHINQNLIMSQALGLGSSFAAASAAALTAPEQRSTASLQSSSLSSGGSGSSASGSSITSFDSNNLIDDKRQHQQPHHELPQLHHQQQQQQQHSRIQAKDTAGPYPIPVHVENHLEATHGIDGADNVFGTPMYFGTENSTVVTTQIGATAHVPCTVHHIGEGVLLCLICGQLSSTPSFSLSILCFPLVVDSSQFLLCRLPQRLANKLIKCHSDWQIDRIWLFN
ncbi:ecdysone-induced protein 74EF isoform X6 [Drosophila sulfurigaster albostrigata]|uniref:ecdysone-induced protein 74EF isoform X6 n=1 Tax=Drosophila sulfurigaster albostrigata TaxID=89887 RepID=UPI002D218CE0|nr:ecdysone-induced protein 74EF isoform X6 [Drosophila sulfurigaster albostrigata]